jgi:tyrosine-protein phosphatase SIW14
MIRRNKQARRPVMRRFGEFLGGLAMAVFIVGAPLLYRLVEEREFRNFRTVRNGVLYRSGQLSLDGFERICHDYGIRAVISLRPALPGQRPPDWDEEQFCMDKDIYHFRLPPKHWWAETGPAPADENVREFLRIMDNPKYYPVLIHCFAGTHRTGAYCCVYRMEYDHWDRAAAIDELYRCGYEHLFEEEDVHGYLETYQPRRLRSGGEEPAEAV